MSAPRRGRHPLKKAGFTQQPTDPGGVHPALLKQGRKSGQLNLSNRQLVAVPDTVWSINEDVPEEARNVSLDNTEDRWWEQVELTKLILASNKLTEISEDVKRLSALTVLDIHDNQLTSLPESLGACVHIQKLNLSHNKLNSLSGCITHLTNLLSLHVEHNEISEIPSDVGRLSVLEDMDISHNMLQELPGELGFLTRCTKLNVANNKLKVMPSEIGAMKGLRVLDVTHNSLQSIPDNIGHLEHLEQLYLRHNKLTHLPVLQQCNKLKELHVGNNAIFGLTADHLQHLGSVSVLDLRDNKLAKLPIEITLLEELERLDLTNNDLSGLPYELGNMSKLKSVVLDGNPMKSIRRDIIMRGTMEIKKHLSSRIESVDVPDHSKGVQPQGGSSGIIGGTGEGIDAHTVSTTKSLDYSNKQVSIIPDDVWEVATKSEVTVVNFSKNTLTQLPSNLVLMADSLQDFNLGFNKIQSLHSDIGLFLSLTTLDLRNNMLSDLPSEIVSLQRLMSITLSCNRFRSLPTVLCDLVSLENILASDNQIGVVDATGLQRLPKLACLDLQNNDIMQVPPELANITTLRSLQLGGNPFRNPRPAIIAKGTTALLDYLKSRIPTS